MAPTSPIPFSVFFVKRDREPLVYNQRSRRKEQEGAGGGSRRREEGTTKVQLLDRVVDLESLGELDCPMVPHIVPTKVKHSDRGVPLQRVSQEGGIISLDLTP